MTGARVPRSVGPLPLALVLACGIASSHAADACKGLGADACQNNSACTWVAPQARKDGVKDPGYCRAKTTSPGASGKSAKGAGK